MLEAMATGTPLLAARAASLPEVGGEAAEYFDPHDEEAMAAAIGRVLGDERLREAMAARGLTRVRRYAPEVVRAQVVAFWEEVAGTAPAAAAGAPEHTGVVFHG
jgi:glycosyltransferase involved in cell wall biosynthesis